MNQNIKELREGLSVRTVNTLIKYGVDTKEKLAAMDRISLLKFIDFGKKSLYEVDVFLGRCDAPSDEILAVIKLLRENGYRIEKI